jgi:O-antigen/teichoic acid export membrane protein
MQQYGAGALLSGVWSPFALAQYGGMDSAYPFYLARKKNSKEAQQLIATATFVAYVSVLLVWVGFFIAALSGGWLMSYANVSQPELAFFILGLLPAALIYWLCYLLRYLSRADSYVKITLFGRIAPIVVVLPLLPYVAPEDRLLWSWGLGWIVSFVALIYALFEIHRAGHWPFRRSLFSVRIARDMLKYGVYLIPAGRTYAMISITDRLLVGYLIGTD